MAVSPHSATHWADVQSKMAGMSEQEVSKLRSDFRFENLVLEGGGAKGIAYIGVMEVLAELDLLKGFKRFCGVSMGSVMAALLAVGDPPDRIRKLTSSMDARVFLDAGNCKYLRLLPNLLSKYGWHPATTFFKRMGEELRSRGFDADLTFHQLYQDTGKELCVVAANISTSHVEYFHPKTTPDLPILEAVAMSVAIPVVMQPKWSRVHGRSEIFVDGGLLNNFPIQCFDGWYLSMDPEHCFLRPKESDLGPWFKGYNPKTLGAMVFSADEREIMKQKFNKRLESIPEGQRPKRPNTAMTRKRQAHMDEVKEDLAKQDAHSKATADFLACLRARTLNAINKEEFVASLELLKGEQYGDSYSILFGKQTPADVFDRMDTRKEGSVSNHVVTSYMVSRGIHVHQSEAACHAHSIEDFKEFLLAVLDSLTYRHKQLSVKEEKDFQRIIGIDCDYVTTMDDLAAGDVNFLIEQGRVATVALLKELLSQ